MSTPANQWRPVCAFFLYAFAVVVVGAVLAPWLFWASRVWFDYPFPRIFDRALLIVALIGLWPLLRALGLRSWSETGWVKRPGWWRELLFGVLLGLGSLTAAVTLSVVLGRRTLDFNLPGLPALVGKLTITAVVVALIEETFFRGGLLQALRRASPVPVALAISSAIYSVVHFLKPSGMRILPAAVTCWSGFDCLGHIVSKSLTAPGAGVGFVTLFLAGLILGSALVRTDALYLSIGIHAGWVLPNELVRKLGGGPIMEDWLAWPVLVVVWLVVARLCPRRKS